MLFNPCQTGVDLRSEVAQVPDPGDLGATLDHLGSGQTPLSSASMCACIHFPMIYFPGHTEIGKKNLWQPKQILACRILPLHSTNLQNRCHLHWTELLLAHDGAHRLWSAPTWLLLLVCIHPDLGNSCPEQWCRIFVPGKRVVPSQYFFARENSFVFRHLYLDSNMVIVFGRTLRVPIQSQNRAGASLKDFKRTPSQKTSRGLGLKRL